MASIRLCRAGRRHQALLQTEIAVAQSLSLLLVRWFRLDQTLAGKLIACLMESDYARPRALRHYLAARQAMPTTVHNVLQGPCTPAFMVCLLEDLVHEGLLTRKDASTIEERFFLYMKNEEWRYL
jgi:hypothetical protein